MRTEAEFRAYIDRDVLPKRAALLAQHGRGVWAWPGWPIVVGTVILVMWFINYAVSSMGAGRRPAPIFMVAPLMFFIGGIILSRFWNKIVRPGGRGFAALQRQELLLPAIQFLAPELTHRAGTGVNREQLLRSMLINPRSINHKSFLALDHFAGTVRGESVEFCGCSWDRGADDDRETVYALFGLVNLKSKLSGTVMLSPDFAEDALGSQAAGLLETLGAAVDSVLNTGDGKPPVVRMDHPEFEKHFRVRATDPMLANRIFTPTLMERLLGHTGLRAATAKAVAAREADVDWQVSLVGDCLYLLLPKQYAPFEMNRMFRGDTPASYDRFREDLELLLSVTALFKLQLAGT